MSTDLNGRREQVQDSGRSATTGGHRLAWVVGTAIVVVALVVAGIVALTRGTTTSGSAAGGTSSSSPSPLTGPAFATTLFEPGFTWDVPAWVSGTGVTVKESTSDVSWSMPEGCEPGCQWVGFIHPQSIKDWSTGVVVPLTSAAQYADYVRSMGKGPLTIRSEKPVTVGGLSGTQFTFDETSFTPDAFACLDKAGTDCYVVASDMTTTAVVLDDAGTTLVITASGLTANKDNAQYQQQFEQALSTLRMTGR